MRLPIRLRLTIGLGAALAVLLAALGTFVYVRTGAGLLDAIDAGLRSFAEIVTANVQGGGPGLRSIEPSLIERDETFAQIADESGAILQTSSIISGRRLLQASIIRSLREPTFFDRIVPGIDDVTRVLAVPVQASDRRLVAIVGASLQDRRDELLQLTWSLVIGGSIALCLMVLGAWVAVGGALRPVERMRRQAAIISTSDSAHRLPVAASSDEIARLGRTLNGMLDRIEESIDRERRLVDRASHELRTPLAIQRMDLDLAHSGAQTVDALGHALRSVSEENEHLTRIAEDLLVLARARAGQLPIRREQISLRQLLDDSVRRHRPRATEAGIGLHAQPGAGSVQADPRWLRQAIDNLVGNAVRHTPPGGRVDIRAERRNAGVCVVVEDTGAGFPDHFLDRAFEPFSRSNEAAGSNDAAGLGLAIVRSIVEAHRGTVTAVNRPGGGAQVTLTLPDGAQA